jgi:hypothetical protein
MRHSYVVPMRWMVIYGYGVPGGALNLSSTNYPDHGHVGDLPLSGKDPHGIAGNRTLDLMISSQKRRPLDHEAGPNKEYFNTSKKCYFSFFLKYRVRLKLCKWGRESIT